MAQVGIKELLEAGVHFGHQTRRWNPKMRRYIFGERDGIHIIDLQQTEKLLQRGAASSVGLARRGGTVLFVGTKKQARDAVKDDAEAAGMPYVNQRWLGGLLTNFRHDHPSASSAFTTSSATKSEGQLALLPTRERRPPRPSSTSCARTSAASRTWAACPTRCSSSTSRPRRSPSRGAPSADPDHRPRRHQLRPGRGRLRDPRQRRRDPLLRRDRARVGRRDRRGQRDLPGRGGAGPQGGRGEGPRQG